MLDLEGARPLSRRAPLRWLQESLRGLGDRGAFLSIGFGSPLFSASLQELGFSFRRGRTFHLTLILGVKGSLSGRRGDAEETRS